MTWRAGAGAANAGVGALRAACVAAWASAAWASPAGAAPEPAVGIVPAEVMVSRGGSVRFRAFVAGAAAARPLPVTWAVAPGGGTVDAGGRYTAPAVLGTWELTATLPGQARPAATARVTVTHGTIAEAAAACGAMPIRPAGRTVHFCDCQPGAEPGCSPGDDASPGTTPVAPKRTYEAAAEWFNSKAMRAGDTVAFCRGGAFTAPTGRVWGNVACRPGSALRDPSNAGTCDIRDYAPPWGGSNRPILAATGAANLLEFSARGHHQGIRVMNLELRGGGRGPGEAQAAQWGLWLYGKKTDFLVCNNTFDGWSIAVNFQSNQDGRTARNTVLGNRILNSGRQGFLGRGSDLRLESNYWLNNGSSNNRDHTIYVSADADPDGREYTQTNGAVVGNQILAGVAPRSAEHTAGCPDPIRPCCQGNLLIVHGKWDGFAIEDNFLDGRSNDGPGCWGISVEHGGFPDATWFRNFGIRRNVVTRTGNLSLDINETTGVVIENNVIVPSQPQQGAIVLPEHPHRASPADDVNTRGTIRNNTIFFPAAASRSVGIKVAIEGDGYVIANNAIHFEGGRGTCFDLPLPLAAYAYVDHNLCSGYERWEATRGSLGAWRQHSRDRFDGASLSAWPRFRGAPDDLSPDAGSPLLGAADRAHAPPVDHRGKARPAAPGIGALEQ